MSSISGITSIAVNYFGGESEYDGPRSVVITVGGIDVLLSSSGARKLARAIRKATTERLHAKDASCAP